MLDPELVLPSATKTREIRAPIVSTYGVKIHATRPARPILADVVPTLGTGGGNGGGNDRAGTGEDVGTMVGARDCSRPGCKRQQRNERAEGFIKGVVGPGNREEASPPCHRPPAVEQAAAQRRRWLAGFRG